LLVGLILIGVPGVRLLTGLSLFNKYFFYEDVYGESEGNKGTKMSLGEVYC